MSTTATDSVIDRVTRVKGSLSREGSPESVQAVVDGPCPSCGSRDVVTVRADLNVVTCEHCDTDFTV